MKKLIFSLLMLCFCISVCTGNAEKDEITYIILPASEESETYEASDDVRASADVSENSFTIRSDISFGMTAEEVLACEEARGMHLVNPYNSYTRDTLCILNTNHNPFETYVEFCFDENGHLVEIIYVFDNLLPSTKELTLEISQHDADYAAAMMLYNLLDATLEQKYGYGKESGFPINSYCNCSLEVNESLSFSDNKRRLVPYIDGYIVIEHIIVSNGESYLNVVCYEYLTDDAYGFKLHEKEIQNFLNEIL